MRVLLTGGNSFIGRHLAKHFLRSGLEIAATYRTSGAMLERLQPAYGTLELFRLDLADRSAFSALPRSIDAVVHVAAASPAEGVAEDDMVRGNVLGTQNVLRYALAAGAGTLIYASSLSVHGRVAAQVVDETTPVIDPGIYGASKYFGERLLAAEAERLPGVAIRLPGVLGRDAHRAWIPTLLNRVGDGEALTLYNPDAPFNNAAHVDDLGPFIVGLLTTRRTGFAAFPVGAAGTITVREVAERLIAASGKKIIVKVRAAPQSSFTISSSCAIRDFAYNPMEIGVMLDRYCKEALDRGPG